MTTELPCNSVVSTLATAKSGSRLVAASGWPSSPVMLGSPAAAEPCNRAKPGLDWTKPASVLTTTTDTKPCPSVMVEGTGTTNCVVGAGAGDLERSLVDRAGGSTDEEVDLGALGKAAALDGEVGPGQDRILHTGDARMAGQRSRRRHRHRRDRRGRHAFTRRRRGRSDCESASAYASELAYESVSTVGIGVRVGVGLGVDDPVGRGVNVGTVVGGAVTLNPVVAVAGSNVVFPAKFAISGVIPAISRRQRARGVALGVGGAEAGIALQRKLHAGADDRFRAESPRHRSAKLTSVTGLPTITLVGLRLSDRKLECFPEVQVINALIGRQIGCAKTCWPRRSYQYPETLPYS